MNTQRFITIVIAVFIAAMTMQAQNLVQNPEFSNSQATYCSLSGILNGVEVGITSNHNSAYHTVSNWRSATSGTPDYFTTQCSPYLWCNSTYVGQVTIPDNIFAHNVYDAHGQGYNTQRYAGIGVYAQYGTTTSQNITTREYLWGSLQSSLQAGKTYRISLTTRLATESIRRAASIGVYFPANGWIYQSSLQRLTQTNLQEFNLRCVRTTSASEADLDTKDEWHTIELLYTAQGGESDFIIGFFDNDGAVSFPDASDQNILPCSSSGSYHALSGTLGTTNAPLLDAYYFIDNVSIEQYCNKSCQMYTVSAPVGPLAFSEEGCCYSVKIKASESACPLNISVKTVLGSMNMPETYTEISDWYQTIQPGEEREIVFCQRSIVNANGIAGNIIPGFSGELLGLDGGVRTVTISYTPVGSTTPCTVTFPLTGCVCNGCSDKIYADDGSAGRWIVNKVQDPNECCFVLSFENNKNCHVTMTGASAGVTLSLPPGATITPDAGWQYGNTPNTYTQVGHTTSSGTPYLFFMRNSVTHVAKICLPPGMTEATISAGIKPCYPSKEINLSCDTSTCCSKYEAGLMGCTPNISIHAKSGAYIPENCLIGGYGIIIECPGSTRYLGEMYSQWYIPIANQQIQSVGGLVYSIANEWDSCCTPWNIRVILYDVMGLVICEKNIPYKNCCSNPAGGIVQPDNHTTSVENDASASIQPCGTSLLVFPLPSNGQSVLRLNSNTDRECSMTISTATGEQVVSQVLQGIHRGNNDISLQKMNLSPGIYWVRIQQEGCVYTTKLLISH